MNDDLTDEQQEELEQLEKDRLEQRPPKVHNE
jgi:hypothetical protein